MGHRELSQHFRTWDFGHQDLFAHWDRMQYLQSSGCQMERVSTQESVNTEVMLSLMTALQAWTGKIQRERAFLVPWQRCFRIAAEITENVSKGYTIGPVRTSNTRSRYKPSNWTRARHAEMGLPADPFCVGEDKLKSLLLSLQNLEQHPGPWSYVDPHKVAHLMSWWNCAKVCA